MILRDIMISKDKETGRCADIRCTLLLFGTRTCPLSPQDNELVETEVDMVETFNYSEFDLIYVNSDNLLSNLRRDEDKWKVVLIEEEFTKRLFETE